MAKSTSPKEITPKDLYKKFKHEPLVCDCEDDKQHMVHTDPNGERIVECLDCKRFLKFAAESKLQEVNDDLPYDPGEQTIVEAPKKDKEKEEE